MKHKHKIGIVVTNYNKTEDVVFDALNSLRDQTFKNYEVIFIDDRSTKQYEDDFFKKIKGMFENIRIFRAKKNVGTYQCRNYALKICESKYFTNLDSDDLIRNRHLETIIKNMENNNLVASVSGMIRILKDGSAQRRKVCEASLTFDISKVVSELGFYNPVRVGGDTEFRSRIFKKFKNKCSILRNNTYICRRNTDNEFLTSNFSLSARKKYADSFIFHINKHGPYFCEYNKKPEFHIPEANMSIMEPDNFCEI